MMEKDKFIKHGLNFLILIPSITMFIYEFKGEYSYWDSLWILFFILPLVKYISPMRIRKLIYPIATILILLYVLISELIVILRFSFILSSYFTFPLNNRTIIPLSFTISSAIAFPFIVEGIMSKSPQGALGYLIGSSISTIYFITALSLSPLFNKGFYYSYDITGILIYYNLYTLASTGTESITYLLKPVSFIENILLITFPISIVGFIGRLYIESDKVNRQPVEYMAYPILMGSLIALFLTELTNVISGTYYGILITAAFLVGTVMYMRKSDKKDNYEIGTLE
ncbi:hypothetical protein [Cuniculiplasma thermophilum]|uniref:hypothetical protein n=1 Tax=Cuniculiplasma sp. SKW3 TaxID=3400170 RepID=UPI003FD51ADA